MNQQKREKYVASDGNILSVHSIFKTIQGEGPFCGHPAIFIRLWGCNLQCPGCDTDYTSTKMQLEVEQIVFRAKTLASNNVRLVVITGGEPFRQNLSLLFDQLVNAGFFVQVETNGSLPPSASHFYEWDIAERYGVYVVCSPKSGLVNAEIWQIACCAKYVVKHDDIDVDGLPVHALDHPVRTTVAKPPLGWDLPIYIQPMDEKDIYKNARNGQAAVKSCLTHGYLLQLQIHKYVGVE